MICPTEISLNIGDLYHSFEFLREITRTTRNAAKSLALGPTCGFSDRATKGIVSKSRSAGSTSHSGECNHTVSKIRNTKLALDILQFL